MEGGAGLNPVTVTRSLHKRWDGNNDSVSTEDVWHMRHIDQYWLDGDYVQLRPIGFCPALNCNHSSSIQSQHDFMEVGGSNSGDFMALFREMGEPDLNCKIQKVDKLPFWLSSIFIAWMTELLLHTGAFSTHSKSGVPWHVRAATRWWKTTTPHEERRPIFVRIHVGVKRDWWCKHFSHNSGEL